MIQQMERAKDPILRAAGYLYNFDRLAYFNRAAKKAFSLEWVEDHTDAELREALEKANDSEEWEVYAEPRPSQRVINEFLAEIRG
jgi:hypothetical protein